jgi:hypothetical protein
MSHTGGFDRFQLAPAPLREQFDSDELWSKDFVAWIAEAFDRISAEPIVPSSFTLTSGAISLTSSLAEVVTVQAAIGGRVMVVFTCAVSITGIKNVTARVQRDGSDIWAEEEVFGSTSTQIGYGTVDIVFVDEPRDGQYNYDVDMKITNGGTAEVTRRSLTLVELRG